MKNLNVFLALIGLLFPSSIYCADELSPAQIMERYGKAVVLIATVKDSKEVGLGSGFVVKNDGVIVTNYHVIEGAYPAMVKLKNGDVFDDISVIDYNARQDVAVIKIKGFDLQTVNLGNSNNAKVGEKIVVIGNPHGLENSISDGLLSQIRDTGEGYKLHQISAPISAGSSGSPVFNLIGEVIGIATMSDTLGQNLNFSVPINYARGMINSPIKCSLKEFAGLEKEKSMLSEIKNSEKVDNAQILEKVNDGIIILLKSWEASVDGFKKTGEPHKYSFKNDKFIIHPGIYTANQMLKTTYKDLSEIATSDNELGKIKDKVMTSINEAYESSAKLIAALENKSSNAFGLYFPTPDWAKAKSASDEMGICMRKFDIDFIVKYVERIKKDNPKLENSLLPLFIEVYENRDKSHEDMADENKKWGHAGMLFRFSTRHPVVLDVEKDKAADKAGIKENDIILGVVNGPDFKTQMDYRKFQMKTKAGEKYTFRIERNGEILTKTVKLF